MNAVPHRVVVTGLGLVSSLGCSLDEARSALKEGRSGVILDPAILDTGMNCGLFAPVSGWQRSRVPKKSRLNMSEAAMYASVAALDALADARLDLDAIDTARVGVVVGSEFGGIGEISRMQRLLRRGKKTRAGAAGVAKLMNSTASANLAVTLGIHGRAFSPSSSFALGTDCIGQAYEMIGYGLADSVICGATEEPAWPELGPYFENLGLMPSKYEGDPKRACRPYDVNRQGMVMSAGAGILVLESLDAALARNARIYAEIIGYAATNDGKDLFHPTGEGLERALRQVLGTARLQGVDQIDYINTHGTGTRVGDVVETGVLREVLGSGPMISSTKSYTGHGFGAAGALEAVLTLLMMSDGFVAPTLNLEQVDADCAGLNHVQAVSDCEIKTAMSFNIGLGGTNSAIAWRAPT